LVLAEILKPRVLKVSSYSFIDQRWRKSSTIGVDSYYYYNLFTVAILKISNQSLALKGSFWEDPLSFNKEAKEEALFIYIIDISYLYVILLDLLQY